ncbi:uncharacterized protein B0H18DRAFT_1008984 [Fomitopsis serialis]|uniref:uncharacterized protein n=1 Tax=Fomitopsis serialis TaxID=139415 RepID=UPI0020087CE7|nr:uncharacterized protein B0H18DRAFT_1008984 [Neoantrodia serialis]KAH9925561.1 hypothetical protein B0H18DRAFT_1008984 [Neoantrodia serialis]
MEAATEYQESTTIRLEWTVGNLKNLFDGSKGEAKSKVTKSIKFGDGRWQILFYPNSGGVSAEGASFISLYLSCEPTAEEKDNAIDGKWVREGVFKFGFELRNLQKNILFNSKEAHDHSFSHQTQNWGWAQFARRDMVYYLSNSVKQANAFLVICTITTSPSAPEPAPTVSRHVVPKALLDAMGGLLDDPVYSDVEFILPRQGRSMAPPRRIYAARQLLRRVEYFDTMFNSGFAEASFSSLSENTRHGGSDDAVDSGEESHGAGFAMRQFEDSDDEDDNEDAMVVDTDNDRTAANSTTFPAPAAGRPVSVESIPSEMLGSWLSDTAEFGQPQQGKEPNAGEVRNVRPKLSHPSTPRSVPSSLERDIRDSDLAPTPLAPGPTKTQVIIRDAAYATYRAVLYYIYTDTIAFAPLSSTFLASAATTPNAVALVPATPMSESQAPAFSQRPNHQQAENSTSIGSTTPRSRREWIAQWERNNDTGRPRPCSAKAVYRLADKLDLQELKQRAFQHIVKSLTVGNVAYEVFSTFSAAFEDVRKVQVRFFLDHWNEIRESDAMRNVWQQIRLGRHPGFEEVWPVIALNLEFKPRPVDAAENNEKEGSTV